MQTETAQFWCPSILVGLKPKTFWNEERSNAKENNISRKGARSWIHEYLTDEACPGLTLCFWALQNTGGIRDSVTP